MIDRIDHSRFPKNQSENIVRRRGALNSDSHGIGQPLNIDAVAGREKRREGTT